VVGMMREIKSRIENATEFTRDGMESIFLAFLEEKKIKLGDIAQSLRVALTGSGVSPGLFEVMEVLGREKVLSRIERALAYIAKREEGKNS
jgi:glutamyl-tRNA synthetase